MDLGTLVTVGMVLFGAYALYKLIKGDWSMRL